MRYLADLHVHSRFSRATSRDLDLRSLHASAQRKGLVLIGTGDFTHPGWRAELAEQLVPAEQGLFRLRDDLAAAAAAEVPRACGGPVRFVLQAEISTIYKAGDRVRKVHHVILAPSISGAEHLSAALERIGNLSSDGRPILGLDSRDLLETVLESCPGGCLIPAHLWTPWFSVLGSKSGFDSVEACYRDLADHIFAVETGLSSDPPMNWRVSALDRFALVSNSDAHSAAKLARECNDFDTELSYDAMISALRRRDPKRFRGTVEFFPEEGKYHLDGHRKCRTRLTPAETREAGGLCPVCGRKVTVGVMHRVEALADRPVVATASARTGQAFRSLICLSEAVGHSMGRGSATVGVQRVCTDLLEALGSELAVLEEAPIADIERVAGTLVGEAIRRVRDREVRWEAGYDGEFGSFELFTRAEREALTRQMSFFPSPAGGESEPGPRARTGPERARPNRGRGGRPRGSRPGSTTGEKHTTASAATVGEAEGATGLLDGLGPEQLEAVLTPAQVPLLVIAGPGTGKTRTLTTRIAHLVSKGTEPGAVLALTFTNRAAEELEERLATILGEDRGAGGLALTFHSLGLRLLRAAGLDRGGRIVTGRERHALVAAAMKACDAESSRSAVTQAAERLALLKSGVATAGDDAELRRLVEAYDEGLAERGCLDLDDLVLRAAEALEGPEGYLLCQGLAAVFVDEYQDLSPAQIRLLKALVAASAGAQLTAIGDPDQAIYGFRGADPQRLLRFEEDWPGASTASLGRSYRSSETVLQAACGVIGGGGERKRRLWSGIEGEPCVLTLKARGEGAEGERIALIVERLLGGTSHLAFDSGLVDGSDGPLCDSFSEVAVLYRLRAQGPPIAEALGRLGLPIQMSSRETLGEAPEMDEVLCALRVIAGRGSGVDEKRASEAPWAAALASAAVEASAVEALESVARATGTPDDLDGLAALRRAARGLASKRTSQDGPFAGPRRPVDELLDWIALHGEPDLTDQRADRISLLTLHASKGLEWPVVIIAGCEDGLIPYRRPGSEPDLDEERRLFFVGMTRARRLLVLSRSEERTLYGRRGPAPPSPFLRDIEPRLLRAEEAPRRKRSPRARQMDLF